MLRPRIFVSIVLSALTLAAGRTSAQALSDSAKKEIEAIVQEKRSRTAVERKLSTSLLYARRQSQGSPMVAGLGRALDRVAQRAAVERNGMVTVDIRAQVTPALLQDVVALGGQILFQSAKYGALRTRIPLARIDELAAHAEVRHVGPKQGFRLNTGAQDTEGDVAHNAALLRAEFGVDGTGVKVGVLSSGVDSLAARQATGDLGPVTVVPGQAGSGDEGTAMLEIVHDLAPGAQLFFATAFNGEASFAANIETLRTTYQCDIIIDDVFYFDETAFQDGPIAQAVNDVTAAGALYFSAAGNSGSLAHNSSATWEGDFVDSGTTISILQGVGALHSFNGLTGGAAATSDVLLSPTYYPIGLKWASARGAADTDYDLYLLDSSMTHIVDVSADVQDGTGDPFEIVTSGFTGERVVAVLYSGTPRPLRVEAEYGALTFKTNGAIAGHSGASGAISVAAVDVRTAQGGAFTGGAANPVESYSSDGPRRMFLNADGSEITPGNVSFSTAGGQLLAKPDIAAADCVTTSTPGFVPFCGTSAAAPHAGAIAALLRSLPSAPTNAQVKAAMIADALDIEGAGIDVNSGAGIVMADRSVRVLNISNTGTGAGTVTGSGISCSGAACSAAFVDGASVILTATPSGGSSFDGWSGDCTGSGTCVLTMLAAHSVTATFTCQSGPCVTPTPTSSATATPTPTPTPTPVTFQVLATVPDQNFSPLVQAPDGSIYGETGLVNGSNGSVAKVSFDGAQWHETALTTFGGGSDGSVPDGLLLGGDGALYGVTLFGGAANSGTIFKLSFDGTSWTRTLLYSFLGGADGQSPVGLLQGVDGAFYGVTGAGGYNNGGTAYRFRFNGTSWTKTIIHNFGSNGDGVAPAAALIQGPDGALYGTTYVGGASQSGTVFRITAGTNAWTETVLHSFNASDGFVPLGTLSIGSDGALYGVTELGGTGSRGVAYRLAFNGTSWNLTVIHNFDVLADGSDGDYPLAGLTLASDGALYGTAYSGGAGNVGVLFRLAFDGTSWQESVLHHFTGGKDGVHPSSLLQAADGTIYGGTSSANNATSVFYSLSVPGMPTPTATPTPTPTATPRPVSDFNLDGQGDLVWQYQNGSLALWTLNGTSLLGAQYIYSGPIPGWTVRGVGDFNGDGQTDILWQDSTGAVAVWFMNGTTKTGSQYIYNGPIPGWTIRGVGDFNGDGQTDILWQDSTGAVAVWFMNGTTIASAQYIYNGPIPGWTIRATGDMDLDGNIDIVWQDSAGRVAVWYMNGATEVSSAYLWSQPLGGWTVVGTGDFNGDGKTDVLLQDSSGRPGVWLMNGTTIASGLYISNQPQPGWTIRASR
jgi:uncharacterized repeat protein (TIGR03803 family)